MPWTAGILQAQASTEAARSSASYSHDAFLSCHCDGATDCHGKTFLNLGKPAVTWLNFRDERIAQENPQFQPVLGEDTKAFFRNRLLDNFKYVDGRLAGTEYFMDGFSVADGDLYVMLHPADSMSAQCSRR